MSSLKPKSQLEAQKSKLLREKLELLEEKARRLKTNKLETYRPYAKQKEFHEAGAEHRERLFMAGNQIGKTLAGANEWAMHLTGRYPDWWKGRVFKRPVRLWVAGLTGESTRDAPQRLMVGSPEFQTDWGTGTIPADCIVGHSRASGVSNYLDSISVRHVTGGNSVLGFKTYGKGREAWQGPTLDGVWFDEEPPLDIYSEGLTRTNATKGIVMVTFTPLLGMSEVVRMFLQDKGTSDDDVS